MLYFRLALVGVYLLTAVGSFIYGRHEEAKSWELSVAKQQAEASALLADSEAKARAIESKYADLNIQIEKDHDEANAKIDDAYARNVELVRKLGLYDKQARRPSGCSSLPGSTEAANSSAGDTAGIRLSSASTEFLLAFAADADRAAEYGRACHDWAMSLKR